LTSPPIVAGRLYAVLEMTAERPVLAVLGRGEHVDLYAAPNVLLASVEEVVRCR